MCHSKSFIVSPDSTIRPSSLTDNLRGRYHTISGIGTSFTLHLIMINFRYIDDKKKIYEIALSCVLLVLSCSFDFLTTPWFSRLLSSHFNCNDEKNYKLLVTSFAFDCPLSSWKSINILLSLLGMV